MFFFFNDTATTEIYTLSLHDALPISADRARARRAARGRDRREGGVPLGPAEAVRPAGPARPALRDGARRHGHRHADAPHRDRGGREGLRLDRADPHGPGPRDAADPPVRL